MGKIEEVRKKFLINKNEAMNAAKKCFIVVGFDRREQNIPLSHFLRYPQVFYDGERKI